MVLGEQILRAAEIKLSPEPIKVFASGRVKNTPSTGAKSRGGFAELT